MRSAFNSSSASACCISPLNNNIWRYTLGGAELTFLTNYDDENRRDAFGPSVSPDGAEIIFNYAPTGDAAALIRQKEHPLTDVSCVRRGPGAAMRR